MLALGATADRGTKRGKRDRKTKGGAIEDGVSASIKAPRVAMIQDGQDAPRERERDDKSKERRLEKRRDLNQLHRKHDLKFNRNCVGFRRIPTPQHRFHRSFQVIS